jgi:hypothetical protein
VIYSYNKSQRDALFLRFIFDKELFIKNKKVHRLRAESALNRCTVQPFTESDNTRCCENTIGPPEDGHVNARNMSRIVV